MGISRPTASPQYSKRQHVAQRYEFADVASVDCGRFGQHGGQTTPNPERATLRTGRPRFMRAARQGL